MSLFSRPEQPKSQVAHPDTDHTEHKQKTTEQNDQPIEGKSTIKGHTQHTRTTKQQRSRTRYLKAGQIFQNTTSGQGPQPHQTEWERHFHLCHASTNTRRPTARVIRAGVAKECPSHLHRGMSETRGGPVPAIAFSSHAIRCPGSVIVIAMSGRVSCTGSSLNSSMAGDCEKSTRATNPKAYPSEKHCKICSLSKQILVDPLRGCLVGRRCLGTRWPIRVVHLARVRVLERLSGWSSSRTCKQKIEVK